MIERLKTTAIVLLVTLLLAGCEKPRENEESRPRPVTVQTLSASDPGDGLQLAGHVESWAMEDIAAEVAGRLTYVAPEGTRMIGRWVEDGAVILEGDVLARIDPTDYEIAVQAAEVELSRMIIQRDQIAPANLKQSEAEADQRRIELERVQAAFDRDAASASELLSAQTAHLVATSKVENARASVLDAGSAVALATSSLQTAQTKLDRTVIRAPYTGVIDEQLILAGGVVSAGTPIVRLVMLDPMRVRVTVSAGTARGVDLDDFVQLRIDDWPDPLRGKIIQKSASADADTGTFEISIGTRNDTVVESIESGARKIGGVGGMLRRHALDATGDFFVEERSVLRQDNEGFYVWALDPTELSEEKRVYVVRRVNVVPTDERISYQDLFVGRYLSDFGTLTEDTPLAMDPPDDMQDGDVVQVHTERWLMHPGDLVRVTFDRQRPTIGFYVPIRSIVLATDGGASVFCMKNDQAVRLDVTPLEIVGNLQRISPTNSGVDLEGMQLIVEGAHYLIDGEAVMSAGGGE